MKDDTLLKTIVNDVNLQIQVGDPCKVITGNFQGCIGRVDSLTEEGVAMIEIADKVSYSIKVSVRDVVKNFDVGECIRIVQGVHAGDAGQIIEIVPPKHALLLMDHTKSELKVFISNLRKKEDHDPSAAM